MDLEEQYQFGDSKDFHTVVHLRSWPLRGKTNSIQHNDYNLMNDDEGQCLKTFYNK